MNDTTEYLERASKAYYEGKPFLSDEEFDRLEEKLGQAPVGYTPDSRKEHTVPLMSLQKVFVGEDKDPLKGMSVIETPKLDGAALSIQYSKGALVSVITRGDGIAGIDVTNKFIRGTIIPSNITNHGDVQVTGELVAPKSISNARNYAAGALNLKDVKEFLSRDLTFVAYGVSPMFSASYHNDMYLVEAMGFKVVTKGDWEEFPNDGRVLRVDSNKAFEDMGSTSHHPRGAYALKTRDKGVTTTLLDVIWQTGKSGKVTPVAILEEVEIDDAKISRATLNNMSYIDSLDLEIGCRVEVIRAGKIIPCVVGRV